MRFLMSEPKSSTCTRLSEVADVSHDSVNRFLLRETYDPKDLFNEAKTLVNIVGGTLSIDDTVLDKPYSQKMDLVRHFWSGKHHRVVKGLNLITLYYNDPQGRGVPVNYRIYDKADNKTKNDYFLEMLDQVIAWGLKPHYVTGDSWYSSAINLKTVKNHGLGLMFAIEQNRTVSVAKGTWAQVQNLSIPEDGMLVWLREFGQVKLFRTRLKDQARHYIVCFPENDNHKELFAKPEFKSLHDQHWKIEQYHRVIKQVCNIERFQVRTKVAILNHIFVALCGFFYLQKMTFENFITNAYQWKRSLFTKAIATFIRKFLPDIKNLLPKFQKVVNA